MDISIPDTPVGRLLDGRYRVGERLARGGMATVHEAVDIRLDRVVALKIMNPDFAEDHAFVSRFIGEARSAARLSHPNVVAVFDQGEDQGAVYLAMEYVAGPNLRRVLRERSRLTPTHALKIMDQVLSALAAAHRAGIVHRDVKPENVLVGDDGRVKVTDFGLARAVTGTSTVTRGVLLGTAPYISPEQALGEPATYRSDVYSAGIMLFELVTGHPPHDGLTDYVIVRKHTEEDVPPPSDEDASIPHAIDELVLRATARDPERRFADADEFWAAVTSARNLLDRDRSRDTDGGAQWGVAGLASGRTVEDPTIVSGVEPREMAGVTAAEAFPLVRDGHTDDYTSPYGRYDRAIDDTLSIDDTSPELVPISSFFHDGDAQPTTVIVRAVEETAPPPPPPRRERPRRRWRGPVLFFLVLLLATGTALGAWWYGAGRFTSTPSLIRLTDAAAKAEAAAVGLDVTVDPDRQFSENVPAGSVLQTDPRPGERILKNGVVTLILSKGPERYKVPNLVGKTLGEAKKILADNNLIIGAMEEKYDEKIPKDQVISQGTKPNTEVTRNTPVALTVSKGRQPLEIVDYTGKPADEAKRKLGKAGFNLDVAEEFNDGVQRGLVISQDPRSGTGHRGDSIRLVVSKGPEVIPVPGVEGKSEQEAKKILEDAGFKVRPFNVLPGGPSNVLRQEPGAGTPLRYGSTVTLWIF